ncbi:tRNA guanosine(15) transglycosylase TgtA [Thermofilum pendens]|uniref:tRNA-guanine(15) transglycosylase n=1 Tax=Thermofilum pendens (strain DSM 2475 / Hrk 5) TaxID=368408 RepID=A1RX35_THEPD|nr:tRNA guanosine(15) transglycosylase TgtA [Thermofilum pendens]ABL77765.1 tRNA-guanine transglycosylases, various specificities [Thermofilum pendens Hrk 5]
MVWSEVFEIKEVDLLGRIGSISTRRGNVETPTLTPVINPSKPVLEPREIQQMGFNLIMTNSYIIKRQYGDLAKEVKVHQLLGVDTPVMTDSGAYQLMVYGRVEVDPLEIVRFQVEIGSDIGVILDIPTKKGVPRGQVLAEVEETLRRAEASLAVERDGMLLVGPVQGGLYTDIVATAARRLGEMPFDVYAVGGPTQLMEEYDFSELVKLVMTARLNLPWEAPLHLFGAGHPVMLPLAVAMGVDTFDSASYVLYARDDRVFTSRGTLRLGEVEELPCNCPVCSKYSARELRELPKQERVVLLARHNLYVIQKELKEIREAIHEGRLWELLEERSMTHPSLRDALRVFARYAEYIAKRHPVTRSPVQGLFFYSGLSRYRPEVVRHVNRLAQRYKRARDTLVVFEETPQKPFTRAGLVKEILGADPMLPVDVDVAVLSGAFSVIPLELDGFYPLSQYEASGEVFREAVDEVLADLAWFVLSKGYRRVVLVYHSLPKVFLDKLKERLSLEGVLLAYVEVENYDEALLNPSAVAGRIRSMISFLESIA